MRKIIAAVKTIVNAFNDIISFIQTIFKVLSNLLHQIVYLIRYVLQALNLSTSFISTMPAWLAAFATITISICVLYVILGRQGGKN